MISPEEAWQRLAAHLGPLPPRRVALGAAAGRVLAEEVRATVDVPFADVSAMDGYAIAGDVAAGAVVPVLGRVAAGDDVASLAVARGSAVRIMTGAPMPTGADRVVPVEETDGGRESVEVRVPPPAGAHVRRRGEIHRTGDALLGAGHRLTPGALALLAANGAMEVAVQAPPRVALLVTGDEVVPPEATPQPGQLRDSHTAFVSAAVAAAGGELVHLGIARDDPRDTRERLAHGLDADLLLATGGVSRGELDFVEPALAELGFQPLFDAIAIQPGKPLAALVLERSERPASARPLLALGLPGNPASAMVCFWLFARPALLRLQGIEAGFWREALTGTLAAPLPAGAKRDRFLPARLATRDGELVVTPVSPRGSHDLTAFAQGTGLLRIRAGSAAANAGDRCSVLPLSADWP
ncbi:MAG TPA: gephyrin-like molybdotransferase Glp [Thermoanaerobaculia bacterium]|nr:gephyrin-like molybdotransferase Glp [Thermoanaerobaculia bacterium]